MAALPWLTSDDLVASVQRKISFPLSQNTFTSNDVLAFANEEMSISQVPSVLQYHEEYFVTTSAVPLKDNLSRYPVPERAIGMKLRDLFWQDSSGNLHEMTRVSSDDRAFYQNVVQSNNSLQKFYLEGNDIVLTPSVGTGVTGNLVFVYFLRPNQLVSNSRAAISTYFSQNITVNFSSVVAGDKVTIGALSFTAVSGAPSALQFQIGADSITTATNLVNAINLDATYIASNGTPASTVVLVKFPTLSTVVSTTNPSGFVIPSSTTNIEFSSIPTNITNNSIVDFLQTKPGHKTKGLSVKLGPTAVSATNITFKTSDIPVDFVVGDYICSENECIIPQIPSDLHTGLAERTSARILAAMGDQAGLQVANSKIAEVEMRQGNLLDQRVEGAPQKITGRKSLLSHTLMGKYRRRY